MSAYEQLEEHFEKIRRLQEVQSVLGWDHATMMPTGGAEARSEQFALLSGLVHESLTEPVVEQWLGQAAEEELGPWAQTNLDEMRRTWLHANCVPPRLVREKSLEGARCEMMWREARKENDFQRLEPLLQRVLEIGREVAQIKGEALGVDPYDALLDEYDPGGSSAVVDEVFGDLAEFLPGFLEEVLEHQARQEAPILPQGPFPQTTQKELAQRLMEALGFDFRYGRLDTSHHPFCGGYPNDVRLTTFYDEANFLKATMGVLHETGHALYSMGLPEPWRTQPVGRARGMTAHESQSLFVEMQMGRSRSFSRWVAPLYRDAFNGEGEAWSAENLYKICTRVERSLIRVDADEVTYPAHVILRYRLEKAMIGGDLEIADLPGAWREGMKELVGITPDDDRDGCMQDIHWMDGTFGYFPTYTLGALMAAQIFAAVRRDLDDVEATIEAGEFSVILDWLRAKVHSQGSRWSTEELLERATGSKLDARFFKEHLRARYLQGER